MKKTIFLMLLTLCITSCIKDVDYSKEKKEIITNCDTFKDFTVPINNGSITVVTLNGDTIAVSSIPMTIKVPKIPSLSTRAITDEVVVTYITKDNIKYSDLEKESYSEVWQAIMFEDSKNGDYDFNDLVIHVKSKNDVPFGKNYNLQNINIQAIALGSTKVIGLGCILCDGSEHIISDDVRRDLFNNQTGFINTLNDKDPIRYPLKPTSIVNYKHEYKSTKTYWIAWFIIIDGGRRQYAITSDYEYHDYTNVIDNNLLPYGLIVANDNGTFKFPYETMTIFDTYPEFKNWVYNNGNGIGLPLKGKYYKYCDFEILNSEGEKKYKIWDYEDLK